MKALSIWLILILVAIFAASSPAQSGRESSGGSGKANQRKEEPKPQPTVMPIGNTAPMSADTPDDGDVIKINTQLVSVPVRVMDKKGLFVAGLSKEDFTVTEDGVKQEIALFSNENEPFTVALVLDMSYSTTFKIAEIQSAAIEFIDQLRPQDKVMVVSFDQDVHMLCEATNDRKAIFRAIKSTKISTGTSLYEAVDLTMNDRMRALTGRKAIILFTDGVDTTSRRVNDLQNLNDAMELDSLIYTIRYDTFADVQSMKKGPVATKLPPIKGPLPTGNKDLIPFPMPSVGSPGNQGTTPEEYQRAAEYLEQLAVRTGGRLYQADSLVNLSGAFSRIASELREFYSIGYYPSTERVPQKRTTVRIRVDRPGLAVRSRDTYVIAKKRSATRPAIK